ncbi:uncharacterized protein LOC129225506 [Uloborus diversus]|uniref:uncharacterized protein LOC129225506 n=1 Tax=Uloborus diversus TaxID=327109 RepID=UPI00240A74C4|nr:uncharacterized protein LOC129225506 [Uloborus diversus]
MNSVQINSSVVRFLNHNRFVKQSQWKRFPCSSILCQKEETKAHCSPSSRIICTNSKYKDPVPGETPNEQEKLNEYDSPSLTDSFLKENFRIIDNRYFKLITLPHDSYHFEDLLISREFKTVLNRSSFLYDVNLAENSKRYLSEIHNVYPYLSDDVFSPRDNVCDTKKQNEELYQFSAASDSESQNKDTNRPSEEQLLNVINRLTFSLINFFEKPQDYSVYHKNVIFYNNIKGVITKGLTAYIQNMYFLKLYGHLHFAKVKVEILKITHHVEDGSVRVRWRVKGVSRQKVLLLFFKFKSVALTQLLEDETDWLDGFSVFSVGPDGLIYKHVCDKMMPDDDLAVQKHTDLKTQLLGLLGLSPRGATTGSLNSLMPCCRSSRVFLPCKKLS